MHIEPLITKYGLHRLHRIKPFVFGCLLIGFTFFANRAYAEDKFALQTLRAGFYARAFTDFSRADLEVSVKLLSEEIGQESGITTTVTIFDSIPLMRKAFEQGEINFVVASSLNLANDFDNNLLADGFRFAISSDLADSLIVLTRKNEGLDTIESTRGKNLSLVESDPIADLYMDFLAWSVFHQGFQRTFHQMPRDKKANQIILKLFFGQADIICVYQNSYRLAKELNPQIGKNLQIISQLDGIPQGAGLFHKSVPHAFRELVSTKALKLGTYTRGKQLLQLFKADKVVRSTLTDLTATKRLYSSYKKLNKIK